MHSVTKGKNTDGGPPTSFQSPLSMPDKILDVMDLEGFCTLASIQLVVSCSCSLLASSVLAFPQLLSRGTLDSLDPKSRVYAMGSNSFAVATSEWDDANFLPPAGLRSA